MIMKAAGPKIFLALLASGAAFQTPAPKAPRAFPSLAEQKIVWLAMAMDDKSLDLLERTQGEEVTTEDDKTTISIVRRVRNRMAAMRNIFRRDKGTEAPIEEAGALEETTAVSTTTAASVVDTIEYMEEVKLPEEKKEEEEEEENLLEKIKGAGKAGIISYALWEWAFWMLSIPLAIGAYYQFAGHLPDFSNQEDMGYLGAEAFAFVNFARFAVPLRIGLAFSTVGWVQENIVDKWFPEEENEEEKKE